jgi:hypothetical protein
MTQITTDFKNPELSATLAFRPVAELIGPIVRYLQQTDPLGKEWFLMGDTGAESHLYTAFDGAGQLTSAAEAALETKFKGDDVRYLAVWNETSTEGDGASFSLMFHNEAWPAWNFRVNYYDGIHRLGGLDGVVGLLSTIARILRPAYITVSSNEYFEKQVFQDRPGVGWMLYLPHVLTLKEVPEARALVPVMGNNEKGNDEQIGTIIVSITDEPFSDENPEHVKISNAIEIGLVDQDLIPKFSDI